MFERIKRWELEVSCIIALIRRWLIYKRFLVSHNIFHAHQIIIQANPHTSHKFGVHDEIDHYLSRYC